MRRTAGSSDVVVGLIDGPVPDAHPALQGAHLRGASTACVTPSSSACGHGASIAGILVARRDSGAPGICPGCTLLVRPIFGESLSQPKTSPAELARAIRECVTEGARVINISAALTRAGAARESSLEGALDFAGMRGVIVVAAAGNQGAVGGAALSGHPWVVPVAGYGRSGRPLEESNLSVSIGKRGLAAPGEDIQSVAAAGGLAPVSGTSAAAPFVSGAAALLCSQFPRAAGALVRHALLQPGVRRSGVAPPFLNAWRSYQFLAAASGTRS
ncbi:MAG: S8 family serine peptidase [Bryobacterales bacterium]|nr:S8 family serine peptidase [Bryobacterales bacterium]